MIKRTKLISGRPGDHDSIGKDRMMKTPLYMFAHRCVRSFSYLRTVHTSSVKMASAVSQSIDPNNVRDPNSKSAGKPHLLHSDFHALIHQHSQEGGKTPRKRGKTRR